MSVLPSSTAWVRGTWLVMSVDHCRVTENNKMLSRESRYLHIGVDTLLVEGLLHPRGVALLHCCPDN